MNTIYETNRLLLRVCTNKQAGLVTDFYNRNFEEFSNYEPLSAQARTVTFHRKNLDYEYDLFSKGKFVRYYLFEKNNPMSIIGTLSYRDIEHGFYDSCIIGYKIDRSKRHLGYCKEAILFCDGVMFKNNGINRIEATVRPENIASRNLLESIGYLNEGTLREKVKINGQYLDHILYARLKRDFERSLV